MRAAVTTAAGTVSLEAVPDPSAGAGEVLVRPRVVGICGSDLHLFDGDLAALSGAGLALPRIQGHEIGAEVLHDPGGHLPVGQRVAVWPLLTCGTCRLCRSGAVNACPWLRVVGVHLDGGLADALAIPVDHVVPVGNPADPPDPPDPAADLVAAFVEPLSVAVHAVARSGSGRGDRAVVLGAGAVGQGICLALADRGVETLLVDPTPARAHAGRVWGARVTTDTATDAVRGRHDDTSVVFDATGVPAVLDAALDLVRVGGTVVAVGLTSAAGPVHTGALAGKELTVLGSSCCTRAEFAEAARLATAWSSAIAALPVRRHPLAAAGTALEDARRGGDVVKVLVDMTVPTATGEHR